MPVITGTDYFYADYTKEKELMGEGKYGSLFVVYEQVVGHHYKVLDVIPDPKAATSTLHRNNFYLKLQDLADKDYCYYQFDTSHIHRLSFPFLVTGYMQKLKATSIGKKFVFADACYKHSKDYETGAPLTLVSGEKWTCVDVIIAKETYDVSLLLKNTAGQKVAAEVDWLFNNHASGAVYTEAEADKYHKLYGTDFDVMLAGNVRIGWTKSMCSLAWATPTMLTQQPPAPAEASSGYITTTTTCILMNTAN